jgi:adenine-specific DNA-methyltransferase
VRRLTSLRYPRDPSLDPQLVWKGKDEQDAADLVVDAPPIFVQERIDPLALVEDLRGAAGAGGPVAPYRHAGWSNRMILGDSLQVMAGLAEREGLRGKVQCIYIDPLYGIKFNSNFQWSTTSPDVKDGNAAHITREPEQVKAFRDTWRDGIHSYLTYLRDRLTVARDLLVGSGALFVLQHLDRDAPRITGGARPPQHP